MFYRGEARALTAEQTHVIQEVETSLQDLMRQLLDLRHAHPNRVTVAIYSENKDALFELAQGYYSTAVGAQMRVKVTYYTTDPAAVEAFEESLRAKLKKGDELKTIKIFGQKVAPEEIDKPLEFLSNKPEACTGIVFRLEGKSAYAMWVDELGLHTFVEGKANNPVFVHTSDVEAKDYRPPSFLDRRGAIHPTNIGASRRTYQRAETYIEDHPLSTRREWRGNLPAVLAFLLELQLQRAAERLIEE